MPSARRLPWASMDGLEFLAQFRGDQKTPPAHVIIVSTEGHEDDCKRGFEAGASAYLKKPFTPEMLTQVVRELVASAAPPSSSGI